MGISRGVDKLPILFTGTFLAMSLASPVFGALASRWPRRRLIPYAYHFFAANLVGFYLLWRYDLATNTWGKARASATVLFARNASVRAEVFRYKPTLDLTTIWGVFGPQSHTGFSGTLQFAPLRTLSAYGSFTERQYKADTVASSLLRVSS